MFVKTWGYDMEQAFSLFFELLWWWIQSLIYTNTPAEFLVAWLLLLYLLWERYVIVMGLYGAHMRGQLYGLNKWMGVPSVILGMLLDCIGNIFVATFVFRQFPRQWLITTRLKEYKNDPKHYGKWRQERAAWWCTHVLHPIDDGHCD